MVEHPGVERAKDSGTEVRVRQRCGDVERGHKERKFPGNNLCAYSDWFRDWFTDCIRVKLGVFGGEGHRDIDCAACDLCCASGVVSENVGRPANINMLCDPRRLAVVEALELSEVLRALVQELADPPDQPLALVGPHPPQGTFIKCAPSRRNRPVDILCPPRRDLSQTLSRCRIMSGKAVSGGRVDPLTVDKHPIR
jgi:hypothetical protein